MNENTKMIIINVQNTLMRETKMITLHEADEHAPFAHRFISTTRHIVIRSRNKKEVLNEYDVISESVICAYCGHWIERVVTDCNCPASCHAEAAEKLVLTTVKRPTRLRSSSKPTHTEG